MRIAQEKLKEIVASHGKWLRNEAGGERADLRCVDLSGADFHNVNFSEAVLSEANLSKANLNNANFSLVSLCGAKLTGAKLTGANFSWADLCVANFSGANLIGANFSNANLRYADLSGAKLCDAYLCATNLSKTYYQIVRIGSRDATTTYCVETDNVTCGCWNDYKGGTLEEFRNRVESTYGENGYRPNKKYYMQYMAAIEFFTKMAKLTKMEEK